MTCMKRFHFMITRILNLIGEFLLYLYYFMQQGFKCEPLNRRIVKKISWEEWYLKKKIDSLKNVKQMKENMQKVYLLLF
jgi:hypothetical protein